MVRPLLLLHALLAGVIALSAAVILVSHTYWHVTLWRLLCLLLIRAKDFSHALLVVLLARSFLLLLDSLILQLPETGISVESASL